MPDQSPSQIAEIIDGWINTEIRGANVMTRNSDCYNHMVDAAQRLKAKLAPPAPAEPEPTEPYVPPLAQPAA